MKRSSFLKHSYLVSFIILFTLNLANISFANMPNQLKSLDTVGSGQLNLYSQSSSNDQLGVIEEKTQALLLSSEIDVSANSLSAAVTFKQVFKNTSNDWVEGVYVFPLPKNAAVDKMEILVGGKRIIGKIRKKKKAKQLYEAAIKNGQRAALVEHINDELFQAKAGNIPPNSEIEIKLHYVQQMDYDSGKFSITIPTTYTQKYIITNNDDNHKQWIKEKQVTPQKNVNKHINQFNSSVKHPFKVSVMLNTGLNANHIQSTSHPIKKAKINKQTTKITSHQDHLSMDRDFHLSWDIKAQTKPTALSFTEKFNQQYFTSLLVIPPNTKQTYQHPREVIFVIDRSGSMGGQPILQAKMGAMVALKYINPQDTFNIIEFDDRYSSLFKTPQLASNTNIDQAKNYISSLKADGGTEMIQPLDKALSFPKEEGRLRQIVFLTDGAIYNNSDLYQLINEKLGNSRLFTIGIGHAPNAFIMKQIATLGKGTFQQISQVDQVALTINNLFKKLQSPVLTDIKISLPDHLSPEILPNPIPDLYSGQAIRAHIKTNQPPRLEDISIHGKYLGKNHFVTPTFNHQKVATQSITGINKMWAKAKINSYELLNLINKNDNRHNLDIEKLGLDYQLLTSQTAFIAIEEKVIRDTQKDVLKSKKISNQTPYGQTMNTMSFPQTSTNATLTMILAMISLLAALILFIFQRLKKVNGGL